MFLHRGKKASIWWFAVLFAGLFFTSCENDLKKIKALSEQDIKPQERTIDAEITYSDSAHVKAVVFAPLMINHKVDTPYYEMPNGVKILFYDKDLKVINTLTSKYAITKNDNSLIELYKNVVSKNQQGDVFKSEELIWNSKTQLITSSQPVQIVFANGNISNGTNFESNQDFTRYSMNQTTGIWNVDEKAMQQ
ncbi:LPS export ABC transporter periplasmic protein LptC [Mucilaginibacter sp. UR6-1]|uniref:LPS export ABC transporter periplasmic protein LptC n=1 Tax=Mucilaginibacter sp. UR6-1 TaxID=1435643 RepID=UPI001E2F0D6E|nr:LPS export ABC transporter periplasmic protein LptC [Mucilaginibacter sp. UR6-1]MCC8409548.1 LPS export ABC transporter periplasmic protein LptC [Mucilaginibacter sp. UR6-1]